ncbi:hypothetical protein TNIN_454291 [Trichonephila inaurata madagascariensis]|uniref:Uncharacterized protein n=1 Tax=Trichonephila inaurata madagascariensis TaxID=2747483 RepID=A0A8X6WQS4_9ARAC|nr:hypothetical protein TNIN_454291 [Trichonephila inaurata madagascariensis]
MILLLYGSKVEFNPKMSFSPSYRLSKTESAVTEFDKNASVRQEFSRLNKSTQSKSNKCGNIGKKRNSRLAGARIYLTC